jgi:hypothetical protein
MKTNEDVEDICFMNSKIASAVTDIEGSRLLTIESLDMVRMWFGGSEIRLHLLYRASQDGFSAIDFHQRCDNHGPTLSLLASASARPKIFGGFTSVSWTQSTSAPYVYRPDS